MPLVEALVLSRVREAMFAVWRITSTTWAHSLFSILMLRIRRVSKFQLCLKANIRGCIILLLTRRRKRKRKRKRRRVYLQFSLARCVDGVFVNVFEIEHSVVSGLHLEVIGIRLAQMSYNRGLDRSIQISLKIKTIKI